MLNIKKIGLFIGICFVLNFNYHGQPNLPKNVADSLWNLWNNKNVHDTIRIDALLSYNYNGYLSVDYDSSILFSNLALNYIDRKKTKLKEKNYKTFKTRIFSILGTAYLNKDDFRNSIYYCNKALQFSKELKDQTKIAISLTNLSSVYIYLINDFAKAINLLNQSLKIAEKINNTKIISYTLMSIASIHKEQKNYHEAEKIFFKCYRIFKKSNDKLAFSTVLNNLGIVYQGTEEFEKSIVYFKKALKIYIEINDIQSIGQAYDNIGLSLNALNKNEEALKYFFKSLKIKTELNDPSGISSLLYNIACFYDKLNNYKLAINYATKSLKIAKEIGSINYISYSSQLLWEIYKKNKNYKKALNMHEQFIKMRDSINSERNLSEVLRKTLQYDFEKKTATDSISNAKEKEIKDIEIAKQKAEVSAKHNQLYLLFVGIFCLLMFAIFIFNRLKITQKQKIIIEQKEKETNLQKHLVEEKNREILDSITYAKRIQSAILPQPKLVKEFLEDSFVLYKPKDIVAGDFYWLEVVGDTVLFAAADCTGHGVPGAMVSVVCNNGLNRAVREHKLSEPDQILNKTRDLVVEEFEKSDEEVKDGMDISLCALDTKTNTLKWAGANNPLWILRNGEILEFKADKQPIGKYSDPKPFTLNEFQLEKDDIIYIFTDGYQDQFGGPKEKKFRVAQMRELFLSLTTKTMEEQRKIIDTTFEEWKGDLEQVDDVCLIGVRI